MQAEKKCSGFSNTRCFVAGESEGAPLLGAVGGPQQGHGAPQVRMEMIETLTVCNQHVTSTACSSFAILLLCDVTRGRQRSRSETDPVIG